MDLICIIQTREAGVQIDNYKVDCSAPTLALCSTTPSTKPSRWTGYMDANSNTNPALLKTFYASFKRAMAK